MSELRATAKNYAIKHTLLRLGDRVLVAVSGGPDSITLLHLLYELKDQWDLHLEVAHLQHDVSETAKAIKIADAIRFGYSPLPA